MKTIYKVMSRRADGSGFAIVQIQTADKQKAQLYADHLNSLIGLSVWIEEEKEMTK